MRFLKEKVSKQTEFLKSEHIGDIDLQVPELLKRANLLGEITKEGRTDDEQLESLTLLPSSQNPRWLIPLRKKFFISSLAMYQPSLVRAKIIKKLTILLARLGLSSLTIKNRIYLKRDDDFIKKIFDKDTLHYAFFFGTEGCHQKVTIQVMDKKGSILGYIKVSDGAEIDKLLRNEADVLGELSRLEISKGLFPKVLYYGDIKGTDVLILDTLKGPYTRFSSKLSTAHIDFLTEIFLKTSRLSLFRESRFKMELNERLENLKPFGLVGNSLELYRRTREYITEKIGHKIIPFGLCHRDFTPWNTFFYNDKLYVFDWEYARDNYPPMLDLFHFIIQDGILVRHLTAQGLLKRVYKNWQWLRQYSSRTGIDETYIMPLLMCYLLDISLLYIEREKGNMNDDLKKKLAIWSETMAMVLSKRKEIN